MGGVELLGSRGIVFPTDLKDGDFLSVVLRAEVGPSEPTLFVVSGSYNSDESVIYGHFDNEYGDCNYSCKPLYPFEVLSLSKINDSKKLLEDLIRDRNNLRKRLTGIEQNIRNLLK